MKISESIAEYLLFLQSQKRLSVVTLQSYEHSLSDFAMFVGRLGIVEVDMLTASEPREWQADSMERGMAVRSILRRLSALRGWCSYLCQKQLVQVDLMCKVTPPKMASTVPVFFHESDVEKLYSSDLFSSDFVGVRNALLLRMLYETGMRRAEVVGLKLSSIDFSGHLVKVRGKRNKDRLIPIQQELINNIQRYIDIRSTLQCADTHLFVSEQGKMLSLSTVNYIVKKYMHVIAPSSSRCSPHVFRHTFASLMLNEGADVFAIKELLGHSSLNATEIYTHVFSQHLQNTYNQAHPRAKKKEDKL